SGPFASKSRPPIMKITATSNMIIEGGAAVSEDMPVLKIITPAEVSSLNLDPVDPEARVQAKAIIDDVKAGGKDALVKQAVRLGDLQSETDALLLGPAEMKEAFDSLPEEDRQVLVRMTERVKVFALAQLGAVGNTSSPIPGGVAGHTISPVATAGCYAPGGRYPLPSSVIMTAVTARAAGVGKVVVASPRPGAATVAAAHAAGADMLMCIGGAQVVAAMAYG
ncbi:unnamed protein product, partial [Discosporangium mesarthrocarpum]